MRSAVSAATNPEPPRQGLKHPSSSLDKTEVYLYGTLFALVAEQLTAIESHVEGQLGFFGRMRLQSRTGTITNFVAKLVQHKQDGDGDALQQIWDDLERIAMETDEGVWKGVRREHLEYLRNLIRGL